MVEKNRLVKLSSLNTKSNFVILLLVLSISTVGAFNSSNFSDEIKPETQLNFVLNETHIDGDNELDDFAANYSSGGNGDPGDPYIFELNITTSTSGTQFFIENTMKHFAIVNSFIGNGETSGIKFDNVENGQINNTVIYSNGDGIHLLESENNIIYNNVIHSQQYLGILFQQSSDNLISKNEIYNNGLTNSHIHVNSHATGGILMNPSPNNSIEENDISDNYGVGLYLNYSHNSYIFDNYIERNTNWGVHSIGSEFTYYEQNYINENGSNDPVNNVHVNSHATGGILMNPSHHNYLENNEISQNQGNGVWAHNIENLTLYNNVIFDNDETGVELDGVIVGNVTMNIIENNDWFGLLIENSTSIHLEDNLIDGNGIADILGIITGSNTTLFLTSPYTTTFPGISPSSATTTATYFGSMILFIATLSVLLIKNQKKPN